MKMKILEIRDSMTFFLVLCVDMNPEMPFSVYQRWALRRYGFPCSHVPNILMTHLEADGHATNDPYYWGDRTRQTAHKYITEHWKELEEGDVVDVEFILGETKAPKVSERIADVS